MANLDTRTKRASAYSCGLPFYRFGPIGTGAIDTAPERGQTAGLYALGADAPPSGPGIWTNQTLNRRRRGRLWKFR